MLNSSVYSMQVIVIDLVITFFSVAVNKPILQTFTELCQTIHSGDRKLTSNVIRFPCKS